MQIKKMEIIEIIKKNIETFHLFVRAGIISCNYISNIDIYQYYKSLENIKSKMDRYVLTAEQKKVSEGTVRRIVREMEKKI